MCVCEEGDGGEGVGKGDGGGGGDDEGPRAQARPPRRLKRAHLVRLLDHVGRVEGREAARPINECVCEAQDGGLPAGEPRERARERVEERGVLGLVAVERVGEVGDALLRGVVLCLL